MRSQAKQPRANRTITVDLHNEATYFHHPGDSQQAFLTGLAHLYNLIPYQRRAQHAGQCGVEVEGGRVPTRDWFLNLQILTSGGFR
jgi:hypothetical protein